MNFVIRPVRREEIGRLWELMHGLAKYERLEEEFTGSPEDLAYHLFGSGVPRVDALVAERNGILVGYALTYPVFSSFHTSVILWLEDLYVEPNRRGEGIGKALMTEVARLATSRGIGRVGWLVLDWNLPSIDFYENLGARRVSGWHIYGIEGEALERLATFGSTPTAAGPPPG